MNLNEPGQRRPDGPTRIVPAEERHLPDILEVFNEVVLNTTAVYTDTPETLEQRTRWYCERRALGYPVLVAEDGAGRALGFSSFTDFRPNWPGFRHTVEHSVHIHQDARGQGLGRHLVTGLVEEAEGLGKHVMLASVDAANLPSIRMHERLGFARVALLPQVGCKFGRWLDLIMLQKVLSGAPPR